jgi:hypothetical protein
MDQTVGFLSRDLQKVIKDNEAGIGRAFAFEFAK